MKRKLIRKQSLEKLYQQLAKSRLIYAPVNAGAKTEFRYNPPFADLSFEHIRSALSVKNLVFPRVEKLMYYTSTKTDTSIKDIDPARVPETVLWGSRPCDAAAFGILDSIFGQEPVDNFFAKRMEKLTVITFSCHRCDELCFCTSAGLSPDSAKGSDILMTMTAEGDYLADIITGKGNDILNMTDSLFEDVSEAKLLVADVPVKFSHEDVTAKLEKNFEHPFWKENSLRCIGCGACAYVCPTCACFDIQDETRGINGVRYRSWDSCGFGLFTLHTSGHNPRHVQSQRWRQRLMHKFSYMPVQNGTKGCVGCGRCSAGCPVDMNIAEQLQQIQTL